MKQQVYEEALKAIAFQSAPDALANLGGQHPNGVRPLSPEEQVKALVSALRLINRLAQEAIGK